MATTSSAKRQDKPERVTPAMLKVITNLFNGQPAWGHITGRSMYGGATGTATALRRHGFVTYVDGKIQLTEKGAAIATKHAKIQP